MNSRSISYFLSLFCFPISFLAFINILYSSYFDYFLSIDSYFTTLLISLIIGTGLFYYGKSYFWSVPAVKPFKIWSILILPTPHTMFSHYYFFKHNSWVSDWWWCWYNIFFNSCANYSLYFFIKLYNITSNRINFGIF